MRAVPIAGGASQIDRKPSFRLTRRCSIRELAFADEAPHHTTYGAATDCKTAPRLL
jgi:hypothetical protein